MNKVSVIIPTKNEAKNLGRCLASLQSQTFKNLELIVVDNHSRDQTIKIAKKFNARVYYRGPERSAQRNFGALHAKAQYLFFVDADMVVGKKVVGQAVRLFNTNKILAVIVPETSSGTSFWQKVRQLEHYLYYDEPLIEAPRFFLKKAFDQVGGFDKKLIAAEDWDLAARIKKIGQLARTQDQIIHHEGQFSLLDHLQTKFYYAKDIQAYAKKHPQLYKQQAGLTRLKIILKHWQLLIKDPVHAIGLLTLKLLEYLVYLVSSI